MTAQTSPRDAVDLETQPRPVWVAAAAPLTSTATPSAAENRPSRIKLVLRQLSPADLWRAVSSKIHTLPWHERGPAAEPNEMQGP